MSPELSVTFSTETSSAYEGSRTHLGSTCKEEVLDCHEDFEYARDIIVV